MVYKVDAVRATGKLIESYNVTELRTLVIWYKREGDAPVPNTRQQLLQRYIDTCHRGSRFHEMHLLQHSFLILSMLLKMQVMLWPMGSQ